MSLRALVLEDEWPTRSYLVELLRATTSIEIAAAVATAEQASAALASSEIVVDVAFVDVRLLDVAGDVSGLTWARAVAGRPRAPAVVLTTALAEHALAGHEIGVADYLLKPYSRARVATCVARLLQRRPPERAAHPPRVVARDGAALVFLPLDGLYAFEAADRLTYVHHEQGRYLVDLSLAALEAAFGAVVTRVHRSWLVALDRVERLERGDGEITLGMGPGLEVPVSRDRAQATREALLDRAVGVLRRRDGG